MRSPIGDAFDQELARCRREIEQMEQQPVGQPAYLTTMGILDWQGEARLIERERNQTLSGGTR